MTVAGDSGSRDFDRISTMEQIEAEIGNLLRKAGYRLSTAESCTGGLLGHRLTNVPGSSEYFLGGVISYSNEAKVELLSVSADTLAHNGAVSAETVLEMVSGVCKRFGSEAGVAISGVAGPGGGTGEKPVGLVWVAVSLPGVITSKHYQFRGGREEVKAQAAEAALQLLKDCLNLPHLA
jgi:nicotinamide-nucleotide amidase